MMWEILSIYKKKGKWVILANSTDTRSVLKTEEKGSKANTSGKIKIRN